MDDSFRSLATPVAGVVVEKLHQPANKPKDTDGSGQPAAEV
ncbi:uncharacterized protein METZ01_LOCUS331756, partial [marine metagenome]